MKVLLLITFNNRWRYTLPHRQYRAMRNT